MFVYNITMKVDNAIAEEWLQWQTGEHIPEIMSTALFVDHKFFRLLEHDDSDGPTYVVQYFAETKENYDRYIKEFAPALRKKAIDKWGDRFISFRTLLKVMH